MSALFDLYARALKQLGWQQTKSSNVLEKNGCLFCSHDTNSVISTSTESFSYKKGSEEILKQLYDGEIMALPVETVKFFKIFCMPNKCTWHVEYAGWVLKRGYYDTEYSALINDPESYVIADFQNTINSIDLLAMKFPAERRSDKFRKISINKPVLKKVAIPKKSKIDVGVIFRVTRDFVSDSLFTQGTVYSVTLFSNEGIILTAYNKKLSITSQMYKIDYAEFNQLVSGNYIECIEIADSFEDCLTEDWVSCNFAARSDRLPDELSSYSFSKERAIAIATNYKENKNYAPLLNDGIQDKAISEVQCLIDSGIDVSFLCNKNISKDLLRYLDELLSDSYYVPSLPVDDMTRMDLEDYIGADGSNRLKQYSEMDSLSFTVDQKHLLARLIMSSDKDLHTLLNPDYSIYIMQFLFYCIEKGISQEVSGTFLTSGICNGEILTVVKKYFSASIIAFIRTWLKVAPTLTIQGVMWDDFIEQNINNINSIDFKQMNFIFRTDRYSFSRDGSSVYILNSADIPVWRAILVNDTFIVNREQENEIYF